MQHGIEAVSQQQSVASNSQFDISGISHVVQQTEDDAIPCHVAEQSLLVIEASAGTTTLSSVLKDLGFEVLPIDFGKERNLIHLHIIDLDLRQKHSWEFLAKVVLSQRTFQFHGAPACGTASKAREIAMSDSKHGPPPLRSNEYPLGFPWLQGIQRDRVQSANSVYIHVAPFCMWLQSLSIGWSIENQRKPHIWGLSGYSFMHAVMGARERS